MRNLEKDKEETKQLVESGFTKIMYEGLIFYFEIYSRDFKDAIYNHSPIPNRRGPAGWAAVLRYPMWLPPRSLPALLGRRLRNGTT